MSHEKPQRNSTRSIKETQHALFFKWKDKAPSLGNLSWQDIRSYWQQTVDEYIEMGRTPEVAKEIAWGTLCFFTAYRIAEILKEEFWGFKNSQQDQALAEFSVITSWLHLAEKAMEGDSPNLDSVPPTETPELTPTQPLDPNQLEMQRAVFEAQSALLMAAAQLQPISPELKAIVVTQATQDHSYLSSLIDHWNQTLSDLPSTQTSPEFDPYVSQTHLQSIFSQLALLLSKSHGEEHWENQYQYLRDYLVTHIEGPNNLIDSLDPDKIISDGKSFLEAYGLDQVYQYTMSPQALIDAQAVQILSPTGFEPAITNTYLDSMQFKELEWQVSVLWSPESQSWTTQLTIAMPGNEPPRSPLSIYHIVNATNAAEAYMGYLELLDQNLEMVKLPYKTKLNTNKKRAALKRLKQQAKLIHRSNLNN